MRKKAFQFYVPFDQFLKKEKEKTVSDEESEGFL